jgi:hypothetical protein
MIYTFSEEDSRKAYEEWGANCGPNALAFALQTTLAAVRPHIREFPARRYTSPTMMEQALYTLGRRVQKITSNPRARSAALAVGERCRGGGGVERSFPPPLTMWRQNRQTWKIYGKDSLMRQLTQTHTIPTRRQQDAIRRMLARELRPDCQRIAADLHLTTAVVRAVRAHLQTISSNSATPEFGYYGSRSWRHPVRCATCRAAITQSIDGQCPACWLDLPARHAAAGGIQALAEEPARHDCTCSQALAECDCEVQRRQPEKLYGCEPDRPITPERFASIVASLECCFREPPASHSPHGTKGPDRAGHGRNAELERGGHRRRGANLSGD